MRHLALDELTLRIERITRHGVRAQNSAVSVLWIATVQGTEYQAKGLTERIALERLLAQVDRSFRPSNAYMS